MTKTLKMSGESHPPHPSFLILNSRWYPTSHVTARLLLSQPLTSEQLPLTLAPTRQLQKSDFHSFSDPDAVKGSNYYTQSGRDCNLPLT